MHIYVENLPLSISHEEVRQLFLPYGTVEAVQLVKDKVSGIVKGTAYVVMSSEVEAEQAIAGLDGTEFCGQHLHITQADYHENGIQDYW
jgi:RNA recognition motif-containing protein